MTMKITVTLRRFATFLLLPVALGLLGTPAVAGPAGNLTVYGTTAASTSGTNYAGGNILASNTVRLDNGATVSGSSIANNGLLQFNQSAGNLLTISNTISGTGTLSLINSGTLQLTGTTGGAGGRGYIPLNMTTNVNSGVLTGVLSGANQNTIFQLGASGTGILNVAGGLVTGTAWQVGFGSSGVGTVNVSSGTFAPQGYLWLGGTSGGTGGNGTLNITGGMTQVGSTTSSSIRIATGTGSIGVATITSGTLSTSGATFIGDVGSGTMTLNSGALQTGLTSLGNASGARGALNILGGTATSTNTLQVGGTGSGTLTVNGGLSATRSGSIGVAAGSNGTVTVTSGTFMANGAGSGNQIDGNLTIGGSGTGSLTINNGGYVVVSGTLSRGVNGTLTLNQGGTLQIGSEDGFNHPFSIASGTSGVLVGDLNYAGTLKFAQNSNGVGGSNVSTYADDLSGTGDLVKTGTGTLNLTGSNSYTGGTTIEQGMISLGSARAIGTTGTITFNGGALQATASNTTDYSARFSSAANQQYAIDSNGRNLTLASDITSTGGSFAKLGSGTITLTGENILTSGTVAAGTLNGSTRGIAFSGTLGVADGAELRFDQATSDTFAGSLAGGGTFTKLGAGALTIGGSSSNTGAWTVSNGALIGTTATLKGPITNNAQVKFEQTTTGTYASIMSGTGSLSLIDTGAVTLAGANTYSGGTIVADGTLIGTTTSLQGAITNNSLVKFDQSTSGTYAGVMSGHGRLTKLGTGAVTLSGTNTYSDGTTVSTGALIGTTSSLQGAITNNALVTFDQSTSGTYAGIISGSGALTKLGSGAVTLSGNNTYSGGTTVSAGSLIGTTSSLQGAITNNALVTFDQSTSGTYAGVISGSGALTKLGGGAVTLSGNNTYSGGTTVSAGTLLINGNLANSAVIVGNGATLGGSGTIASLVDVLAGGTISPGNSPGLLTVGSLDLEVGSSTFMQIFGSGSAAGTAGTDYDQIAISTPSGLGYGGTLDIDFANTVNFANITTFNLFRFLGSASGGFGSVVTTGSGRYAGLTLTDNGLGIWTGVALDGSQTLTFSQSTGQLQIAKAVPEPSTWAMALTAAGFAGWTARRRKRC